jgi:hypothetical protein
MSNIAECLGYVLDSEFGHYYEHICNDFTHLTQDDVDFTIQIQDIDWIKKNIEIVNHIYMRARLAEEELIVHTTTT